METPAQRHLARELERAQAAEAALRQQRAQMIRQVARSPPKKKKVTIQVEEEPRARRAPAQRKHQQRSPAPAAIPTQRLPESPADSQDTVGREIDAAIAKSVAKMLQTPEPLAAPRIVPLPAEAHARASAVIKASPKPSPTFLTSKRRNMHCELDEPGTAVPFPHHRRSGPKRGFLARLFGCFAAPPSPTSRGVPPSPYGMHTPSRPRPASAKVSPPVLQLRGEMEPLRQSLISLKPGLAAAALADESPTTSGDDSRIGAARRSLAMPSGAAATPPTPRFGPGGWQVVDRTGGPALGPDQLNAAMADLPSPASSFESLAAELSDAESPEDKTYRRTPVAGADGRPMVQMRRRMPSPEPPRPVAPAVGLPAPGPAPGATDAAAEALALQAALLRALMVPLPPQAQGAPAVAAAAPAPAPAPVHEVKQTQVSLAQLLGGNAVEEAQPRGRQGARTASRPAAPAPAPSQGKTLRAIHQQQNNGAAAAPVPRSAPVSPQKRGTAPAPRSAPTSRAGSPLRQPAIQPRMTRAAAARNDATQRLLESRRLREQAHLAGLAAAQERRRRERAGKRNIAGTEASDTPAKRPRSAQREQQRPVQQDDAFQGFVLPAAGSGRPVAQPAAPSTSSESPPEQLPLEDAGVAALPSPGPRSPGFYQMLERLALGMSVDTAKVEAEKQPRSPAAVQELRESTPEEETVEVFAGARPNALYAGQPEPSPLVNVAAQKLVSMNEVVARSGSDESGESGDGGGSGDIAVDASSNTLLGQLLEMERSLTVEDLALLRAAIRREGGVE